MTQEEKAKAYDEALERFKSFKERYYTRNTHFGDVIFDKNGEMQKDFEEIFPQLCEDEDERIRKELIKGFKFCKKIDVGKKKGSSWAGTNLNMDEVIAWLEKQKEQEWNRKPCLTCQEYNEGFEAGRLEGVTAGYNKAMKEMEQKEQKPWKVGANAYFTPEQKPAWSEEDEEMLEEIINHIDTTSVQRIPARPGSAIGKSWIKFLKSLRPQPKQEWSEEDEKMIDTIVYVLGQYIDYKAVSGTGSGYATPRYSKEIAWLNSLRPQWRPSEEQMGALSWVLENARGNIDFDPLKDLYEQLKKL